MGLYLWVRLEEAVCLGGLQAACLLMAGTVIPPGLLFGLGLLSTDRQVGPDFPTMATSRERQLLNIPESFAFNVLPSQQSTFTPVVPGGPPKLQSGLTQILTETLLCPGTQCT